MMASAVGSSDFLAQNIPNDPQIGMVVVILFYSHSLSHRPVSSPKKVSMLSQMVSEIVTDL